MSSIPLENKPKGKRYFTQATEDAIIKYNNTENPVEKSRIYETEIHYAFFKLTENIIHTFKFYYTEVEDLEDLQHEIMIFLLSKIHLYHHSRNIQDRLVKIITKEFKEEYTLDFISYTNDSPKITQEQINNFISKLKISDKCMEKILKLTPPKAYSYFGTITKRWLIIYNDKNYKKKVDKIPMEDLEQDESYSTSLDLDMQGDVPLSYKEKLSNFINLYTKYCTDNLEVLFKDSEEIKIADAILELFRKRDKLEIFNKKALYMDIREMIDVKTPKITSVADVLKEGFKKSYTHYLEHSIIKFDTSIFITKPKYGK